jgi:hypothetical protein
MCLRWGGQCWPEITSYRGPPLACLPNCMQLGASATYMLPLMPQELPSPERDAHAQHSLVVRWLNTVDGDSCALMMMSCGLASALCLCLVQSPHYTPQPSPLQQLYKFHAGSDGEGGERGLSQSASEAALALSREASEAALGSGGAGQSPGQPEGRASAGGPGRVPSREISAALAVELAPPLHSDAGEDAGHMAASAAALSSAAAAQHAQQLPGPVHHESERDQETAALLPPGLPRIETRPKGGKGGGTAEGGSPVDEEARAAQLASLAEQVRAGALRGPCVDFGLVH